MPSSNNTKNQGKPKRARRALLYMPGDDMHKIKKATTLGVDCICMDTEDGVAFTHKMQARQTIAKALNTLEFDHSEALVRINPVGSGLEKDDLAALLPARPDGIVVPKVETAEQIRWVNFELAAVERHFGWTELSVCLIVIVETAAGIVNLAEIAAASPRLEALIFGAEDFASSVGAKRTKQGIEVLYARSAIKTHASANNLQAIDMVYVDFHDLKGLQKEAEQGADLGFDGKQIIHPNQVKTVHQAFTPSDQAISQAAKLIEAFQHHQQAGRGAFAQDGKMIDAPIIKAAQSVLIRARAAGKIN
jgi:citrate lyase beta subunit